jgi:long-chain acyl-CoA synthetase
VTTGGAPEAAELDELCLRHLARYKRPRGYQFVGRLPKNAYGKVLKTELRKTADNSRAT